MRSLTITVDEKEIEVTPSFSVIERIETRFGLMEFLKEVSRGTPRVSNAAWVIYCATSAAGDDTKYKDIGQWALDNYANALSAATDIVTTATNVGSQNPPKKK